MIDILRLVPGFSINYDADGVIGFANRGNWGQEGKILLQLDGQQMNDGLFLSNMLQNHYDVNQIQRIEISRGPGSSIYGGSAELSVINIITKDGEDINGVKAVAAYSRLSEIYGRQNFTFMTGKKINDFEFSLSGFYGDSYRTNKLYASFYGVEDSSLMSKSNVKNINLKINYKNLSYKFILDYYSNLAIYDIHYFEDYNSILSEIKYDAKVNDKLTITPKFNFKFNQPWYIKDDPKYNRAVQNYNFNINVNYDITDNINLIGGTSYDYNLGYYENTVTDTFFVFYNNEESLAFQNISSYLQTILQTVKIFTSV